MNSTPNLIALRIEECEWVELPVKLNLETSDLKWLVIRNSRASDIDVAFLKNATVLCDLQLCDDLSVNDQVVTHIASLSSLEYLNLSGTLVTDESLDVIGGLPRLKRVDLRSTGVTQAALEKSKIRRPDIEWK